MTADLPRLSRMARLVSNKSDRGVYAILYAILIVIMVSMAGFALDISAAREDRRADKSVADSAAIAGGFWLDTTAAGGMQPYQACLAVWKYLHNGISAVPDLGSSACAPFSPATIGNASTYCQNPTSATMPVTTDAGNGYTVQIEWPVPQQINGVANPFLSGDLAPGTAAQSFDAATDGDFSGCSRLGVAVSHHRLFGISGAIGFDGTTTLSHSVINVTVNPGNPNGLAALNVLDPHACQALATDGQGQVIVNRSTDGSAGIIAVESDGSQCAGNNNKYVINLSSQPPNLICATGTTQPTCSGTNPGTGVILSHAMDGSGASVAYPPTAGLNVLSPVPTPEGGTAGWLPVTNIYGCVSGGPLAGCSPTTGNWINALVQKLASGSPPSSAYTGNASPTNTVPTYGSFHVLPLATAADKAAYPTAVPFTCTGSASAYVPPGNWFVNCPDGSQAGFQMKTNGVNVVFGGGTVVFAGGIDYSANGGCLAFNVPVGSIPTSCPGLTGADTDQVTTTVPPPGPAIVYVRGDKGLSGGSSSASLIMPETFVYQAGNGKLNVGGGSGQLLWTAPGAGPVAGGYRQLQSQCLDTSQTPATVNGSCMTSHFDKLTYWNANSQTSIFGGQGAMQYVGVFFTPREPFQYGGQSCGSAQSAQFWSDTLTLTGQGCLKLTPNPSLQVQRPFSTVSLIR